MRADFALEHLGEHRPLKVAAVQLASPFSSDFVEKRERPYQFVWKDAPRRARIDKFFEILNYLTEENPETGSPDIIVFPEYSIPREAHGPKLQTFANERRCILIPGSYYDTSRQYPRKNVCKIYIPGALSPYVLAKKVPTPTEERYIDIKGDIPNVARFIWSCPGKNPISINVFLCRDYLSAFAERSEKPADGYGSHTALYDWDHEGLYVVLMHSNDRRLFEGQAGLDIRGLRGKPKFVLLSNNSDIAGDVGTALLGPSDQREHHDVITSLPSDIEGILYAEFRPWKIELSRIGPDARIDNPTLGRNISLIKTHPLDVDKIAVQKLAPTAAPVFRRGVWHPAFLEFINRSLLIEFYKSTNLGGVLKVFDNKVGKPRVRNVFAAIVRGEHDVVIRRYTPPQYAGPERAPALYSAIYSDLQAHEFNNIFGRPGDTIRVNILPRGILKYRGQKIDDFDETLNSITARFAGVNFTKDAGVRREILSAVASIASNWDAQDVPPETRKLIEPLFFRVPETNILIGAEFGNGIRETYVFINRPSQELEKHRFLTEIINTMLMSNDYVREILKIDFGLEYFQYLIKLKCTAYQADKIVRDMRVWASTNDIVLGTRTIDVSEHLTRNSIDGLVKLSDNDKILKFQEILRSVNEEAWRKLEYGDNIRQFSKFSDAVAQLQDYIPQGLPEESYKLLEKFYVHLCVSNLSQVGNVDHWFMTAFVSWHHAHHGLVHLAGEVLKRLLKAKDETEIREILERDHSKVVRPDTWDRSEGKWNIAIFFKCLKLFNITEKERRRGQEIARDLAGSIRRMRNNAAHVPENSSELKKLHEFTGEGWEERFDETQATTDSLVQAYLFVDSLGKKIGYHAAGDVNQHKHSESR